MPMADQDNPTAVAGPKDRILEATIALMKQTGLTGAGINQILARSGAPKGSLYYYFPGGKEQITREALTLYAERVAAAFDRVLSSKKKPADKIRALFLFVADRFEDGSFEQSCAVGAVTLDLNTDDSGIRAVAATAFASWRTVIARHLPVSSAKRRFALAGLVLSTIEGAYVRGRADHSKQAFVEAGEWLALLVQQVE